MKHIALIIIGLLIWQLSYAQKNYQEAYIITTKGDSLKGYIDYRNWDANPKSIRFKSSMEANIQEFSPKQIQVFGVAGERYISAVVEEELSPRDVNQLEKRADLNIISDTVFLQALMIGEKSLFYLKVPTGNDLYYIYYDSSYHLLIYKKYLKTIDSKYVIAENKKYIGQLALYLNDCPAIASKLNGLHYNKSSFIKAFQKYYKDCLKTKASFSEEEEHDIFEWGVIAGVSNTSLSLSGSEYPYLAEPVFPSSTDVSGGIYLEIVFKRSMNHWSINNEMIYSSYSTQVHHSSNTHTESDIELGFIYIKINNMFRYKYPVGKVFIYTNIGLSNGICIAQKNHLHQESSFNSVVKDQPAIGEVRKWEFGLLGGLGVRWKDFSIEGRYEMANGMSNYLYLGSRTHRFYAFLGYRF